MCGIAGIFGQDSTLQRGERRDLLQRMCDVITHRGPDDEGFLVEDQAAIGMRRLSIIDVSAGHQPISNEDGTIWIVFNGEIYNFPELRDELIARGHTFRTHSDTEAIVHLYEEEGERCVERLRGMFGFAIYDRPANKLFIARDRVGKKPLHYALVDNAIVFGSEIKSLLQHPSMKREVNYEAISDYLTYGYTLDPTSAFRGISKLPPGHTLTFHNGRVSTRQYWDFEYKSEDAYPRRTEKEYIEELRRLLAESVRIRLMSEVPLGAFLSGGIDSSTVVGLMAKEMNQPVKTFSIGFSEADFDELEYSRVAANHFKTEHREFVVTPNACQLVQEIAWHHDEPFADMSCIPNYIVAKMAREFVTVVLSGDGGDELFAGYKRYVVDRAFGRYDRIPSALRRPLVPISRALPQSTYGKNYLRFVGLDGPARYIDTISYFSLDAKHKLLTPEFAARLGGHDSTRAFLDFYHAPDSADHLSRLLYLDSKTYLPGDILTKVDRTSMAHSIEARVPLVDHKLIEFVQTIPSSLKMTDGNVTKHILKQAVADFVPHEILYRPKQGFGVPLAKWFNHDLRDLLNDTLTDRRARERGYFNPRAVQALIDEHRSGRRDNSFSLWGLLMLETWHREFIDQQPGMYFEGAKSVQLDQLNLGVPATN